MDKISGTLSGLNTISGSLSAMGSLAGNISMPKVVPPKTYDGEYEVDPDFVGVVLATAGKMLTQDVNVHPMQVEYVINPSGGRTVYIGGV